MAAPVRRLCSSILLFSMPTALADSPELRAAAVAQRDRGVIHPGKGDYDEAMALAWGGPAPRWFADAMADFPKRYASARGRAALVTGGTGGIGFYCAKLLAAVGLTVIIPARPGLEHEATGAVKAILAAQPDALVTVPTVPLDLGSLASVREFGAHMRSLDRSTVVDVLCLNAGRGGAAYDAIERTTDGFEVIMQVNLFGHALLVQELLPLLRRSAHARIVAHSSSARFNVRDQARARDLNSTADATPWEQYSLTKAAMCLLVRALNRRLEAAGVTGVASAADPGLAATGVNVQHDLARTLGLDSRGVAHNTRAFHDQVAWHAADGALPLTLAALAGHKNQMYGGDGVRSDSLAAAAHGERPGGGDPIVWPVATVEAFWKQLVELVLDAAEWQGEKGEL